MADAAADPFAGYYSGRPLGYDPSQQAHTTAPQAPPPQPVAGGEQANGLQPPQPQPPQDAGEQANHTHVHGVPGYYNTRLSIGSTAASTQRSAPAPAPAPAPAAASARSSSPAAAAPPPAAVEVEQQKERSFIGKLLMCLKAGNNAK